MLHSLCGLNVYDIHEQCCYQPANQEISHWCIVIGWLWLSRPKRYIARGIPCKLSISDVLSSKYQSYIEVTFHKFQDICCERFLLNLHKWSTIGHTTFSVDPICQQGCGNWSSTGHYHWIVVGKLVQMKLNRKLVAYTGIQGNLPWVPSDAMSCHKVWLIIFILLICILSAVINIIYI